MDSGQLSPATAATLYAFIAILPDSEIDAFFAGVGGAGKAISSVGKLSKNTARGISQEQLNKILGTPKGQRPDPSEYMSKADINAHLAKFDEGAIRFTSKSGVEQYKTIGPKEGFVLSKKEFDGLMQETQGNLRLIEQKLGLDKGYLANNDTAVYYIPPSELKTLRMPSGNEDGANHLWRPGGKTSGGVTEGIVDLKNLSNYHRVNIGD